jgi:hypothetical protein
MTIFLRNILTLRQGCTLDRDEFNGLSVFVNVRDLLWGQVTVIIVLGVLLCGQLYELDSLLLDRRYMLIVVPF